MAGIDDYHCFVLDPKLTQDAFVTAALIKPQRTGIVHHVILYEAVGAQATAAMQLNAASGGKGWTCFGGPGLPFDLSGTSSLSRLGQPPWIAAWVPGHTTNALPNGTGVLLHKGAKIVMQVHYNLIEASGPDRSQAQLRLRPATTPLTPLETQLVAAPVELPCPDGVSGPQCNRQQTLQEEVNKYGASAAFVPAALLKICNHTLADYPPSVGAGTSISTTCDRAITQKETIYGVAGHMHLRGRDISVVLNPDTPKEQTLLHIPAWVFHWQDVYYLQKPSRGRPGRHDPRALLVRQLEGRPAGDRREATDAALRPLGRRLDGRDVPRDAQRRDRLGQADRAQLVQRVERCDLVRLGERRVVEHRVDEVVDRAAEAHHRLADVHDLGRARAERVHAEQLAVLGRDEQLHEPVAVAEDLPARELAVARDADLVGDRRLGQLLLGLADVADLGDRVDADRKGALPAFVRRRRRCRTRSRPLLGRGRARLGKPITSPTA